MKKIIEGVPVPPYGVLAFALLYAVFCYATASVWLATLCVALNVCWTLAFSLKKDPTTMKYTISTEKWRGQTNIFYWFCTLFLPLATVVVGNNPARFEYNEPAGIWAVAVSAGYVTLIAYEYWRQRVVKLPITSLQQ